MLNLSRGDSYQMISTLLHTTVAVLLITYVFAYDKQKNITKEVEQELANVTWQRDQCRHLYKQGI